MSLQQIAFTMQLKPGCAEQYQRRHDALWPELRALLHAAGIRDYSIFLAPDSGTLFAVLRRTESHTMAALPAQALMQRWWEHMADLMETGPGSAPLCRNLVPMFHLD